jgi:hypothetical protein
MHQATSSLGDALQLGEPVEHEATAVTPIFPRLAPRARYVTLVEGLKLGARVREVSEQGAVPELVVDNPTTLQLLLYDGEELVGAKQDRILNVTVLVPAHTTVRVPVSCVERGRWSRRSDVFAVADHAPTPELRRRKAAVLAAAPLERGIAQGDVWRAVDEEAQLLDAFSPTAAQADLFRARRRALDDLAARFPCQPGQAGALVARGADALTLDYVSRPEAFALIYPKLLRGYLLDRLARPARPVDPDRAGEFLAAVCDASATMRPSVGAGEDLRLAGAGVLGSGLVHDGEVVQLSAYSEDHRAGMHRMAAELRLGRSIRPNRRRAGGA